MKSQVKLTLDNLQKSNDNKRRNGMPAENIFIDTIAKDDLRKMVKEGYLRIKVFKED